ncbi:MAG: M56 family metallopeptidase [Firmicutes bacterium]|nr:M56 family metallopeptidase [Bacillota bacterium]
MEDLFLELLSMSVNASCVVLAVIIMRLIFRRVPKWVHCAMWALVAFRLICPFSIESEFSVMPSENPISQIVAGSEEFEQDAADTSEKNSPEVGSGSSERQGAQTSVTPRGEKIAPKRSVKQNVIHYGAYVWIIGVAAIAVYGAASYGFLRRRVAEAVRLRENIYQCDRINSPFMMGIIRPKIYLPFGLSGQNMQYVIAHEQAHIRHRDNLTKIFAFALTAVYWFNPITWLAYVLLCRDIELACDESVIRGKNTAERKAYSMALLECSADNSIKFIYNASPIAFGEIGVKKRVVNVLKNKKCAVLVLFAVLCACVLTAVLLLTKPLSRSYKDYSVDVPDKIDRAVAQAMLEYAEYSVSYSDIYDNYSPYSYSECMGEGHIILGYEETESELTVYVLGGLCIYQFTSGNLVGSGCAANPKVLRFDVDSGGNYIYKSYEEPDDGELWFESLKDIFPKDLAEKVLDMEEDVYGYNYMVEKLNDQCHEYAKAYLKEIGRNAKVGNYNDFDFKILSDYGVSDEVSNAFSWIFPEYGLYVGNFESVENGVRYIYEQKWSGGKNGVGNVRFHKYEYESGRTIEIFTYEVTPTGFKRLPDTNTREVKQYYESWDLESNETIYMADDGNTYRYKLTLYQGSSNYYHVGDDNIVVLTNNKNLTYSEVVDNMETQNSFYIVNDSLYY